MSGPCPKCGAATRDGDRFCIMCGTALPRADAAGKAGFSFKWLGLAAVFMVVGALAACFLLGFWATIFGFDIDEETTRTVLVALGFSLGMFGGAILTAVRSPSRTIREPVLASIAIVVVANLATDNAADIVFGWVLPAALAFGGAILGEHLQARGESVRAGLPGSAPVTAAPATPVIVAPAPPVTAAPATPVDGGNPPC